jgi:uncharacterized membrane protein YqjE
MADPDKGAGAGLGVATAREPRGELENIPGLLSRLGEDVTELFDTKLRLLKVEVKEDVQTYVRGGVLIGVGGVIAVVGFALLNVAVAFGVSTLFEQSQLSQPARYALGFVITGGAYLLIGGIIMLAMKSRLAKADMVPNRSLEELRKDKQWLKNEL